MDKNGDDSLSDAEMSILEENSLEPCMRPYLTSCDQNADQKLSSDEWCCCFSNVGMYCNAFIFNILIITEIFNNFLKITFFVD